MTTVLGGADLASHLSQRHPDVVEKTGDSALWVRPESVLQVLKFLKDDP